MNRAYTTVPRALITPLTRTPDGPVYVPRAPRQIGTTQHVHAARVPVTALVFADVQLTPNAYAFMDDTLPVPHRPHRRTYRVFVGRADRESICEPAPTYRQPQIAKHRDRAYPGDRVLITNRAGREYAGMVGTVVKGSVWTANTDPHTGSELGDRVVVLDGSDDPLCFEQWMLIKLDKSDPRYPVR